MPTTTGLCPWPFWGQGESWLVPCMWKWFMICHISYVWFAGQEKGLWYVFERHFWTENFHFQYHEFYWMIRLYDTKKVGSFTSMDLLYRSSLGFSFKKEPFLEGSHSSSYGTLTSQGYLSDWWFNPSSAFWFFSISSSMSTRHSYYSKTQKLWTKKSKGIGREIEMYKKNLKISNLRVSFV